MRTKRAEELSKRFANFIGESVAVNQETWTHQNIRYSETNGVPKTTIRFSHFYGGKCNQLTFGNLDEVEEFINKFISGREEKEILFRRFT